MTFPIKNVFKNQTTNLLLKITNKLVVKKGIKENDDLLSCMGSLSKKLLTGS